MTVSIAVRWGNKRIFWNVRAMPRAVRRDGRASSRRLPSKTIPPSSAFRTPVSRLKKGVLPAAFGRMSGGMAPVAPSMSSPLRAKKPPNRLVRPLIDRQAGVAASGMPRRPAQAAQRLTSDEPVRPQNHHHHDDHAVDDQ